MVSPAWSDRNGGMVEGASLRVAIETVGHVGGRTFRPLGVALWTSRTAGTVLGAC